jgi:hypothetical protein
MRPFNLSLSAALSACVVFVSVAETKAQSVDYFNGFGSFESSNPDDVLNFGSANSSTSIPGWVVRRIGDFVPPTIVSWLNDDQAQDGERYLQLRAIGNSSPSRSSARFDFSISPIALTTGELYELTFWAAGGENTLFDFNQLQVMLLNGTRIDVEDPFTPFFIPTATQTDVLDWSPYSLFFTSRSPNEAITVGPPSGSWSNVYVDNFSLRVVPEPGGALLFALSAGLLGLQRMRKHRR